MTEEQHISEWMALSIIIFGENQVAKTYCDIMNRFQNIFIYSLCFLPCSLIIPFSKISRLYFSTQLKLSFAVSLTLAHGKWAGVTKYGSSRGGLKKHSFFFLSSRTLVICEISQSSGGLCLSSSIQNKHTEQT